MIRRFFLPFVTFLTAVIFIGRLVGLQLMNSSYKLLSDANAVVESSVYPERGYIYDRHHKLLVSNQPVYDLMAIPENISPFDTLELAVLLGVKKSKLKEQIDFAKNFSVKLPSIIIGKISKERNAVVQEKIWKYSGFFFPKKFSRKLHRSFGFQYPWVSQ